jgi:hypothetical protein
MPGLTLDVPRGASLERQVRRLADQLRRDRAEVPGSFLREWLWRTWSGFAHARVRVYLPILVERTVRDELGRLAGGDAAPPDGLPLRTWAWFTAERLLAVELPRRWAHSRGVAHRAEEIAPAFPPEERDILVASAWLHDIGYATPVAETGLHQLDGARYLARHGLPARVCALVAHHAGASAVAELVDLADDLAEFPDDRDPVRDALWYCDMTTGPRGERVSFADRMAELRRRRTADDPVIRALTTNLDERAAAVRRTEERLRAHRGQQAPGLPG